jgi:hypothetical protein
MVRGLYPYSPNVQSCKLNSTHDVLTVVSSSLPTDLRGDKTSEVMEGTRCCKDNTLTQLVRQAAPIDLMRIIAISRNPQLDVVFGPYSDRNVKMDNDMLNMKVGYTWIDSLQQHALVLSHAPSTVEGHVYQSAHMNPGTETSINAQTLSGEGVVASGNYTDVDQGENIELGLLNSRY